MEPSPPNNNEGADPSPSSVLQLTFRNQQVPVTFDRSVISWELATAALRSEPFETWCRRCERRVPLVSSPSSPHDDTTANQTQQQQRQEYQQLQLHSVELQSIDMFGPRRVGFIKLQSHVTLATVIVNEDGSETVIPQESKPLPGICFLRGSAVSILVALFCSNHNDNNDDTEHQQQQVYSLLVEQPRVPIGQVACWELPAGMVDSETETVSGIALQELQQECGIVVDPHGLVDLTELAFGDRANAAASSTKRHGSTTTCPPESCSLQWPWHLPSAAVPPSPGGCDEVLRLLYLEKTVTAQELTAMQGRLQGLRSEGEYITLRVVPMDQVWKVSGDAKAMMYVLPTIPIYSKCL